METRASPETSPGLLLLLLLLLLYANTDTNATHTVSGRLESKTGRSSVVNTLRGLRGASSGTSTGSTDD